MFLQLPFQAAENVRGAVLIINTVLLLAGLVAFELVYAEKGRDQRRQLLVFFPFLVILIGLLAFAVYRQAGGR